MRKNTSIVLGDHFVSFIDKQVTKGTYASTSEVVRAGLRLLEEQTAEIDTLQAALIEGEESGDAEDFDIDKLIAEARQEFERDAKSRDAAA